MISILYPIYELYNDELRLNAFNQSLEQLDNRFNIIISDTGKQPSKDFIKTNKKYKYIYKESNKPLFNKSKTINNGIDLIDDELFIILDAEIIMKPKIYDDLLKLNFINNHFVAITKHLHCNKLYKEKSYKKLLPILLKDKSVTIHDFKPGRFIFTNKKSFLKIGKFDESFIGYGKHDEKFLYDFRINLPKENIKCLNIWDIHIFHNNERPKLEDDIHKINKTKLSIFAKKQMSLFNDIKSKYDIINI